MCLGLELWVPNLVNMWRHVVLDVVLVMWSSRSGQKEVCTGTGGHATWSKGGCEFIEKKSRHRNNVGQCFAKNGVVFLFVPFFALRKKGNLFFHHPRFCTRIWVRLFLRSWFLIASYALSNMAGIPDPLDTPLSAFKISESTMQPHPDHFVLSAI